MGTDVPESLRPAGPPVVLFDFDGVVRHWRTAVTRALDRRMGLPAGTFEATAHAVPEYELGVLGRVTFDDWCAAVAEALARVISAADAADAVDEWRRYRGDLDARMVELIEAVKVTARVGLVSNAHDCLRSDLRALGVDELFEHVTCSAELGAAKPSRAIYLAAAEAFGVTPFSCVFIDDRPDNVHAAQLAGMRSEQFQDPSSCEAFIRSALHWEANPRHVRTGPAARPT